MLIKNVAERSSWSRCGWVLEVSDVTEKEALDYLSNQGLSSELASKLYELVGGRVVHLEAVAKRARDLGGIKDQDKFEGM
jgi:hypothetical protein